MHIVGSELEIPFEITGVGVQCQHRIRVEVVAEANITVPVGSRVSGTPVDQVQFRVIGAGNPGWAAAILPGIAGPGVVTEFTGAGDSIGAPDPFPGLRIIGVDKAANTEFTASDPGYHQVLDDQGCRSLAVAGIVWGHFHVPEYIAGTGIDGNQMGIERTHEQGFAEDGDTAVVAATANAQVVRHFMIVAPVFTTGCRVHGDHIAGRFSDKHDAVDNQWYGFGAIDNGNLVNPLELQLIDVIHIDLIQQAVALAIQGSGIHQPVFRLIAGIDEPVPGHG